MPPTGLDGTYTGTCIVCFTATDTALAVRGEPNWHAAALVFFGVPNDEAIGMTEYYLDQLGQLVDGHPSWRDAVYRVCSECAARNERLPAPVLALDGVALPTLLQPAAAR